MYNIHSWNDQLGVSVRCSWKPLVLHVYWGIIIVHEGNMLDENWKPVPVQNWILVLKHALLTTSFKQQPALSDLNYFHLQNIIHINSDCLLCPNYKVQKTWINKSNKNYCKFVIILASAGFFWSSLSWVKPLTREDALVLNICLLIIWQLYIIF